MSQFWNNLKKTKSHPSKKSVFMLDDPSSKKFNSLVLFLTEEAYSHGGLQTRELGQTPLRYHGWLMFWPAPIWKLNLVQVVVEQTLRLVGNFVYEATNSEQSN